MPCYGCRARSEDYTHEVVSRDRTHEWYYVPKIVFHSYDPLYLAMTTGTPADEHLVGW